MVFKISSPHPHLRLCFFRTVPYDDKRVGFRLSNASFVSTATVWSLEECGKKCSLSETCLSYNFCGRYSCELNSLDAFSEWASLVEDAACIYVGMQKTSGPVCEEDGQIKSPLHNTEGGNCAVGNKGTLGHWSHWVTFSRNNNDTHFDSVQSRNCAGGSHTMFESCDGPAEVVLFSYVFFKEPKTFWKAVETCKTFGGQLLGDIEDITEELWILFQSKLQVDAIWLGVTDYEQEGTWLNFRGHDVTESISWFDSEPSNSDRSQHYLINDYDVSKPGMKDKYKSLPHAFVCSLVYSELTDWSVAEVIRNISDLLIVTEQRQCVPSSFGNPPACSGPLERTMRLNSLNMKKTWQDSVERCELPDRALFDKPDGTHQQLWDLLKLTGSQDLFLGIRYDAIIGAWLNMEDQDVMSLKYDEPILWAPEEPLDYVDHSVLKVSNFGDSVAVRVADPDVKEKTLCLQYTY